MSDERLTLTLDLSGPDGNVYKVIVLTMQLLSGEPLERFKEAIREATQPTAGKRYHDILAIVNSYVHLVDWSGLYPEYPRDEAAIIAAVDTLNEQLKTLPDTVPCSLEGLYPEFDQPEHGPEVYLALLGQEIEQIDEQIEMTEEGQHASLQQLKSMLLECISALHSAGVPRL